MTAALKRGGMRSAGQPVLSVLSARALSDAERSHNDDSPVPQPVRNAVKLAFNGFSHFRTTVLLTHDPDALKAAAFRANVICFTYAQLTAFLQSTDNASFV